MAQRLLLALLLTASAAAQGPGCTVLWPKEGLRLAGQTGTVDMDVFLHLGYPAEGDHGISGLAVQPRTWLPGKDDGALALVGAVAQHDCTLHLKDGDNALWELRFTTPDRLEGTRTAAAGGAPEQVRWRSAPPAVCGGGPWKRFRSTRWPVSFAYPASWRIHEDPDLRRVYMQCFDVQQLALGASPVELEWGPRLEREDPASRRPAWRANRFVTFRRDGREWMIGSCGEAGPGVWCQPARRSPARGMTLWRGAAGENRRYRPGGGYLGQGAPPEAALFLLPGGGWVTLEGDALPARLVNSVVLR